MVQWVSSQGLMPLKMLEDESKVVKNPPHQVTQFCFSFCVRRSIPLQSLLDLKLHKLGEVDILHPLWICL